MCMNNLQNFKRHTCGNWESSTAGSALRQRNARTIRANRTCEQRSDGCHLKIAPPLPCARLFARRAVVVGYVGAASVALATGNAMRSTQHTEMSIYYILSCMRMNTDDMPAIEGAAATQMLPHINSYMHEMALAVMFYANRRCPPDRLYNMGGAGNRCAARAVKLK